MLDNHPRHQLRFIIDNYGSSIIENPRRCRGMLKDLAPKNTRETNLLMLALDNHIVTALMQKTHTPLSIHLDILAQRLHNNFGTQKEFAFWAVESWALALDVIESPSAQKITTPEPAPILKPEPKIIIPPKPAPVISSNKSFRFIVQHGVATDTETGLMWLRFAHGQRWENGTVAGIAEKVSWHDAMEISKASRYGNHSDWRVPNLAELKTLVDVIKGKKGNYIDADVFPKNNGRWFWSSSSKSGHHNCAVGVGFDVGSSDWNDKNSSIFVRLVRS